MTIKSTTTLALCIFSAVGLFHAKGVYADTCPVPVNQQVYSYQIQGETVCVVSTLSKHELKPHKLIKKFKKVRASLLDFFDPSEHTYEYPKTSMITIQVYATTEQWRAHLMQTYPGTLFETATNVGGYYQRDASTIHIRYFEPQEGLGNGFHNSLVHEYVHHAMGLLFKPDIKDFEKKFNYNPLFSYVWLVEGLAEYLMADIQYPGDGATPINKLRIYDDLPLYLSQNPSPLISLMQENYSIFESSTRRTQVNPRPYIYGSAMFEFFIQNNKHKELMGVIETLYKPSSDYNNQSRELYRTLALQFGKTYDKVELAFFYFLKNLVQDRPIIPMD